MKRTKKETDVSEKYESVKKMIWSIVHQMNGISKQDKDDFFQEASIYLCNNVIPKFDPSKNVKFKDFAYICIKNFILRKVGNLNKMSSIMIPEDYLEDTIPEVEVDCEAYKVDRVKKVDELKELIEKRPELFKKNEILVLKMMFENPRITHREMSQRLGFSFASGTIAIISKLRKRMKKEKMFQEDKMEDEQ